VIVAKQLGKEFQRSCADERMGGVDKKKNIFPLLPEVEIKKIRALLKDDLVSEKTRCQQPTQLDGQFGRRVGC